MPNRKSPFKNPVINIVATVALCVLLAVFYIYATGKYDDKIKNDFETLDTDKLSNLDSIPRTCLEALDAIGNVRSAKEINTTFLEYCYENIDHEIYNEVYNYLKDNDYDDSMWEKLCGYSIYALYDLANGYADSDNYIVKDTGDSLTLSFAGDVSLDKKWNWSPLQVHAKNRDNLLASAFSEELGQKMITSDLFCVNLESPFVSANKSPIDNQWRHAASLDDIGVLGVLGIDMVNIANDRIYDYSAAGFSDTLDALYDSSVLYIGGGSNIEDATSPRYLIAGGRKIAFVSASALKEEKMAPEASNTAAGIDYAGTSVRFTSMIKEARESSDYVVVYLDWGSGKDAKVTTEQSDLAHSFINAGADIVLGCRAKTMQAIEYFNGKPIIYGLGNFWYETDNHDALFVELKFTREDNRTEDMRYSDYSFDKEPKIYCYPCTQRSASTSIVLGTNEGNAIIDQLVNLSGSLIHVDDDGLLTEID